MKRNRHPREGGGLEQPLRRRNPLVPAFAGMMILLLAGCHGSTLDAVYPGSLGYDRPPAVNLPPQDAGLQYQ
mgnify:CR=1 FL=1